MTGMDLNNTIEKPDRRRFERIISELNEKIKERDEEYKKLRGTNGEDPENKDASSNAPGQINFWMSETSRFKAEKEMSRNDLRSVIAKIETLQQELKAKKEETWKLETNLYYRDENKLLAFLRRLEDQYSNMQTKNAREESALINEINKVKRSQKQVVKWRKLVLEREEMTKTLADLKSQKNTLYRSCKSAKMSEGDCRIKERQCKSRAQALGKELDELYNEKRDLVLSYEQDRKLYAELAQQKKQQLGSRRAGETDDFWSFAGHSKQQVKRTSSHKSTRRTFSNDENSSDSDDGDYELFYTEKQTCRNLISYLQSFLFESTITSEDCGQESSKSDTATTPENSINVNSMFEAIAKKGDSDEEGKPFPGQTSLKQLKKRHSRKEKRRLTHSIPLAPNIFSDFERVGLKAPVNYNEVSIVLDKLKDKLKYYEDQTLLPLNFSYSCDKYPYATSESELTMDSSRFSILSLSEAADESPLRNFSQNSFLDNNTANSNEYSSLSLDDNSASNFNRGRPLRLSSGIESDRPPIVQLADSQLVKNVAVFKTPAVPLASRISPSMRSLSMEYLPPPTDHVIADNTSSAVLKRRRCISMCPMVVSKYRNRVSLVFDEGFSSKESST